MLISPFFYYYYRHTQERQNIIKAQETHTHTKIHILACGFYCTYSYRGADRKRIEGHSEFLEGDPFTSWRPRRALPREYFIEIMVVADAKMVDYHGHGLFNYILVLMSTVSATASQNLFLMRPNFS